MVTYTTYSGCYADRVFWRRVYGLGLAEGDYWRHFWVLQNTDNTEAFQSNVSMQLNCILVITKTKCKMLPNHTTVTQYKT